MALTLTPEHIQAIQADAEQAYPHEGCGLMLGTFDRATQEHILVQVKLLENAWQPAIAKELTEVVDGEYLTQTRRYWIDPKALLLAQQTARAQGLSIIGVYHSHPDHPAEPSECDLKLAWSDYAYIIVSVQNGKATDLRCWQLNDQQNFQAKPITITPNITDRISPSSA